MAGYFRVRDLPQEHENSLFFKINKGRKIMFFRKAPIGSTFGNCLAFVLGTAFITPVYSQTFSYVPGTEAELLAPVETSFRSPYDINAAGDVVGRAHEAEPGGQRVRHQQ
jgi:hypothetical protein